MVDIHIQTYTCENGVIARMIIPENATKSDLLAIKEMVDVIIKRRFKVEVDECIKAD